MPQLRTIGIVCFIAILGAVLGYAFRRPAHSPFKDEKTIRLWIPPDALSMGTVWEDEHFPWTVPIENQEDVSVEVASFSRSCSCLSIKPDGFVLEPGERRELHMQIDLTKQRQPNGEVSIALSPRLKTMPGTEMSKLRLPTWKVTGLVRPILAFDRSVYLGRHSELSQPFSVPEIPIEVLVPIKSLSVECSSASFSASVQLPPLGQGTTVLRLAQILPQSAGPIEGVITLKPVHENGKPLPARQLQLTGRIVPDVESVPPTVQVGGRRLGQTFEEVIVLRSITGKRLGMVRAESNGEGLSVEVAKENGSYLIRQKVCGTGLSTNFIRFRTESGNHDVTITVPISYTGIKAE